MADKEFFKRVLDFANRYNVIVCHDAAYTEMGYDGYRPMSFLEVEGRKKSESSFTHCPKPST